MVATTLYAAQSPAIPGRKCILPTRFAIALSTPAGSGTQDVLYSPAFENVPKSQITAPLGLDATQFTLASELKTGCTLTVTGCTTLAGQNVEVVFESHERS